MTHDSTVEQTDAHATHGGHVAATVEYHFDSQDLEQFDADDVQAGRAIGKMLSMFFFYTVIVMAIAGIWTFLSTQ